MAEIKKLAIDEFKDMASRYPFNAIILAKDYYITFILYLVKDTEGMYFKGGTALQKIFLNYSRLSEDIDFTVTTGIEETKNKIIEILNESKFFEKITKDKDVKDFIRLVVHYKGFSNEDGVVFIDLNKRAKLLTKPERHEIKHFYKGNIPEFSVNTLAKEEMVAEKIAAAIGRNKPRDHYDIYQILKHGLPINEKFVAEKCRQSGDEFNIIKMFNQAQKLHKRWREDLKPLLTEDITFEEIMQTLAKHFKLKEEKEKQRNKTKA